MHTLIIIILTIFTLDSEPILIKIDQIRDITVRSVNLTWSSPEAQEQIGQLSIKLNYSLKVISKSDATPLQLFQVQEPFLVYTAHDPEDPPPCEIYNFSVTATYIGAMYTGAGCSVPSPVISRMLPSLPDISRLESTLKYSASADSQGVTLTVSFMVSCCHVIYES